MSITRVGASKEYVNNWAQAFSKKKAPVGKSGRAAAAKKTSTKKRTTKKRSSKQ